MRALDISRQTFVTCCVSSFVAAVCCAADRTSTSASDGYGQTLVFYGDEVAPPRLGQPKRSVLYAFDPVRDKAPCAVFTSAEKLPEPVAIAGCDVLVLTDGLLDARSGRRTPFLETGNDRKVLAVKDGKVFVKEQIATMSALDFDTDNDERTTIKSYGPAHCRLYVVDTLRGNKAVRLTTLEIEEIVGRDDDCLWVINYDKPRHLYRVPLDSGREPEQIMPIADDWAGFVTECTVSPTGRFLAIASMDGKSDVDERLICVFDREQKKAIFHRSDVPQKHLFDNINPLWGVEWLNDDLLRYGLKEAATLDVSTGKHLVGEEAWALIEKETPNVEKRAITPPLESTYDGRLYFRGDFEPIAISPQFNPYVWVNNEYAVSADGVWATVDVPGDDRVYLIDGKARTRTVLQEDSGWGFKWLTPGVVGEPSVRYYAKPR